MLSRALSSATVTLLIGCFAAIPARAQNLEAGKSPSQIFAGTCTACHKGPRGLLRTVPAGSLPSFLREHYTTSSQMASLLSSFLISNGASDTRNVAGSKQAKDAKSEAKPGGPPEQVDRQGHRLPPQEAAKPEAQPQQAAKPDADGLSPQGEAGRHGRKRLARPGEAPDVTKPAVEGQPPVQAAGEHGPEGRKSAARLKLGRRGKPGSEEPPKPDAAKGDTAKTEPTTGEPVKDDKPKSETAKDEGSKPEGAKPSGEAKSETAKSEAAKVEAPKATDRGEPPVLRADPVPPVTPAPKSAEGETRPVQTAAPAPSSLPEASVAAPTATAEPAAPPAITASAPPPATIAPAGPPAPPISQ
jgi:hypothetical protein